MAQATIDTTVTGLQGVPVAANTPAVNQALVFNGTSWVPTTQNFLPLSGGTITGQLSVAASGSINSLGPITASGLDITGQAILSGPTVVSGRLSVTGSYIQALPANAQVGSFLGGINTSVGANLAIASYSDGTNWRQLPGTGSTSGSANVGGGWLNTSAVGQINLWVAPVAADGAIITPTEIGYLGVSQSLLSSNLAVNRIQFGVYSNNYAWALNYQVGYNGASGPSVQFDVGGSVFAALLGFNSVPSWYPWVNVASAGGGAQAQANIGFAGSAAFVSWPTNFSSDRRVKSNITASRFNALNAVRTLQIHSADWAESGDIDRKQLHHDCCFIADEVEPLVPRAVCKAPDETGVDLLNPLQLVAVLWKAVQELDAQVKQLQGK